MKHWQETAQILDRLLELGRNGRSAALATVTRIEGSTYRRPGAKLLIEDDDTMFGGVSGGCLEEDVRQVGLQVLSSGHQRFLQYKTGDDDNMVWGLGLSCDGQVDILVQPIAADSGAGTWARMRSLLEGDSGFAISQLLEEGVAGGVLITAEPGRVAGTLDPAIDAEVEAAAVAALRGGVSVLHQIGARQLFTEVLLPPPTLLVCGAGDDARPLVTVATTAGFRVWVADRRRDYLTAERFPQALKLLSVRPDSGEFPADSNTYAVVMTHSLAHDTEWVRHLLATSVRYIGVLGPRARTVKILGEVGATEGERVYGPVGLDVGADGPEQVALAIVAEVLSVWSGRQPQHLRDRAVPIHA